MMRYDVRNLRPNTVGLTCGARIAKGGAITLPETALQPGDWAMTEGPRPFLKITQSVPKAKAQAKAEKPRPGPEPLKPEPENNPLFVLKEKKDDSVIVPKKVEAKAPEVKNPAAVAPVEPKPAPVAPVVPQEPKVELKPNPSPPVERADKPEVMPTLEWKLPEMLAFCSKYEIKLKGSRTKPRIIEQVKAFFGGE